MFPLSEEAENKTKPKKPQTKQWLKKKKQLPPKNPTVTVIWDCSCGQFGLILPETHMISPGSALFLNITKNLLVISGGEFENIFHISQLEIVFVFLHQVTVFNVLVPCSSPYGSCMNFNWGLWKIKIYHSNLTFSCYSSFAGFATGT